MLRTESATHSCNADIDAQKQYCEPQLSNAEHEVPHPQHQGGQNQLSISGVTHSMDALEQSLLFYTHIAVREGQQQMSTPKTSFPKTVITKHSDLMLGAEEEMDEDRRREMLCHWAAALCHMTLLMWWVHHHLQDSDQELTQSRLGGD